MRRYSLSALLFTSFLHAQTSIDGPWRTDTNPPFEIVLRSEGPIVTGAVSSCSTRRPIEISDGAITGATVAFKCIGPRSIAFTGTVNSDQIVLNWEKQTAPGADPFGNDPVFGDSSPRLITLKRAPSASEAVAAAAAAVRRYPAVTFDRILKPEQEPQNWLTYSGNLLGHRHSALKQIAPANVKNLELTWLWQTSSTARFEATALVDNGVLYTVSPPNDVYALDAATGTVIWSLSYRPNPRARASGGGGRPNRGLAMLGGTLFLGTLDAHLLAINAYTGKIVWDIRVADPEDAICKSGPGPCYVITHAPLIVKDKVIVGVAGSEGPTRCFIAAFDAKTGKEVWRFYTIPAAGEPGNETWAGDSWKIGGGGIWNTGAYDPALNLTYWGTGNPYPWEGATRAGDNLYTNAVVALDADTGKLKWHYQFTPHDTHDWDAAQIPVLTDLEYQGRLRKAMLWANRNGMMYALDRITGQFLYAKPFVQVNWLTGFDEKGRPIQAPTRPASDAVTYPGLSATNWYPPSYSPTTGLFYVPSWDRGTVDGQVPRPSPGVGALRAFDPKTGNGVWQFERKDAIFTAGALSTASGIVFTGVAGDYYSGELASNRTDRYFYALDAHTGQLLWQTALTGSLHSGPMTYSVNGKQFVSVAAGNTLFAFALRD